jgi:hypothetical protein
LFRLRAVSLRKQVVLKILNQFISEKEPMKTIKIVCLLSALLSFVMASEFVPHALTHNSKALGVFGYTDIGDAYQVDTGAGLVFNVRKTDGSITSIVFNGTEYKSTTNRFSQIASGLGTPTTVTPETVAPPT